MQKLQLYSANETKKLAAVVEGAVRTILASEHGKQYTLARKIGSLREVLCHVKEMRGENSNWLARAEGDVMDFLLTEVGALHNHLCGDRWLTAKSRKRSCGLRS